MSDLLDEAERLLAEATPGPWTTSGLRNLTHIEHDATRNHIASMPKRNKADAALIARAPTLIAELVAMVRSERKKRALLLDAVSEYLSYSDQHRGDDYFKADRRSVRMKLDDAIDEQAASKREYASLGSDKESDDGE